MTPSPVTVLYHADCLDGFGAAYAAWCRFEDAANYRPMHHGEAWDLSDITGHTIYILDFSFAPGMLERMAGIATTVIQIDHHASALQAWAGRVTLDGPRRVDFDHPALPLSIHFDLDKSGARLAWEYFHPNKPVPLSIQHIEDLDMWRFALPGTREYCRALRLLPFDFATWHELISATADNKALRYAEMLTQGKAIETFFQREVDRLSKSNLRMPARLRGEPIDALQAVRHGQTVLSDGNSAWLAVPGLAINAPVLFASELGNCLAGQSEGIGLTWQLADDGDIKVSLRSQGSAIDVSSIAARYGGGGHPNAAGFRMPAARFFSEVLAMNGTEH